MRTPFGVRCFLETKLNKGSRPFIFLRTATTEHLWRLSLVMEASPGNSTCVPKFIPPHEFCNINSMLLLAVMWSVDTTIVTMESALMTSIALI